MVRLCRDSLPFWDPVRDSHGNHAGCGVSDRLVGGGGCGEARPVVSYSARVGVGDHLAL